MSQALSQVRTRRLVVGGIGLVYLVAFVSLAVQVEGLYGSRGILPASDWLRAIQARLGDGAWRVVPTLFWLDASDAALAGACWLGAAFALALLFGVVPTLAAAACWVLYFSLFQIGRVFLGFQWDILLLEAGFLAIFLAPLRLRMHSAYDPEPLPVMIWMMRWLVFRLMFASGMVKLLSQDPAWWNLTALEYHYWTQPLPTWTAWIASQLPPLVQRASTLAMFLVELVLPWFVFGPRVLRLVAFAGLVGLQVAIAATGNYTFFNLLSVVLCFSLLDDRAVDRVLGVVRRAGLFVARWPDEERRFELRRTIASAALALVMLPVAVVGGAQMLARLGRPDLVAQPVVRLVEALEPWHLASSYGLFAVMTKQRPEVVLEVSEDGERWEEVEFRYKPGDVMRRPRFVAPHQPRLDWQMWFAALGGWQSSPWLVELQKKLLAGSPPVVALLGRVPFEGRPPKRIRAMLYHYEFTDWATRAESGAWWRRRLVGPFSPPISR